MTATKEHAEVLLTALKAASGTNLSIIGQGNCFKVTNEHGREMLGPDWMGAKELCDRIEGALYFVQRGGSATGGTA